MTEGLTKSPLTSFGVSMAAALGGRPRNSLDARLRSKKAKLWKAMVKSARIAVDWGDAVKTQGRCAPNLADPRQPSFNLLAFPTGPIMNESGGTTPTKTNFYATDTDPSGTTHNATRLVATANNQAFVFYRTTTCPAIPQGKYGLRFRARIPTGGAGFTLSFGLSTAMTTKAVQDLNWASPANDAATTFEVEMTYAGSADFQIRFPTTGNDMLIDRIQIYYGGLAFIPPWGSESMCCGRKGFCYEGSIQLDAQGNWNLTDGSGGGWLVEPDMANKTYSAITMIHVASLDTLDAGTVAYGLAVPQDSLNGTTLTIGPHLGFETNSSPYEGRVKMQPAAIRPNTTLAAQGSGLVVMAQALSANSRRHFVNGALVYSDTTAFAGITANRWHVGSGTTTQRAHIDVSETIGKHAMSFIWDSHLSDATIKAYSEIIMDRLKHRGMSVLRDFHVYSGDSNWTQATNDWIQLISAPGYFTPKRNIWGADTSVGGTGIAEVYGTSPYPAAMNQAGRLVATEAPILLQACQLGYRAVYHFGVGTNDFSEILGVPNWGTAAYDATRDAVVKYLLNLHANIVVLEYTIIAAGSGSGRDYTPSGRTTINANIRTRQAQDTTGRHFLCDIGGASSVLGDQTTADVGTYLLEAAPGGIHYNPTGDAAAAAFVKPVIEALRTRMGVDTY